MLSRNHSSFQKFHGRPAAVVIIVLLTMGALARCAIAAPAPSPISVTRTANGTYDVKSNNAGVSLLLNSLLKLTRYDYIIDTDVTGKISLRLKNVSLDQALTEIGAAARLKMDHQDHRIFVHAVMPIYNRTFAPMAGMAGMPGGPMASPPMGAPPGFMGGAPNSMGPPPGGDVFGSSYHFALMSGHTVTLNIPDSAPIPLRTVVEKMSQQTGVPIKLAASVPDTITFSGSLTQTSLTLALAAIAQTARLKVISEPSGSLLLVPSDGFHLLFNKRNVAQFPMERCPVCHRPVKPGWSFCPYCGSPLPKGPPTAGAFRPGGMAPPLGPQPR